MVSEPFRRPVEVTNDGSQLRHDSASVLVFGMLLSLSDLARLTLLQRQPRLPAKGSILVHKENVILLFWAWYRI